MNDIQEYLLKLSDRLDKDGKYICADAIDRVIASNSLEKTAQYVGAIGYVLKQNRAMSNCIRKKQSDSRGPTQKIVLECLKEYQDGQNYQDTQWTEKYAQVLEKQPENFDIIKQDYLQKIASNEDVRKDLLKLIAANEILKFYNINDEYINQIIKHAATIEDLLKQEGYNTNFFKLAAPVNRNLWSRFWKPTEQAWWNPMSWSAKNRNSGDKLDATTDMKQILSSLVNINRISNQMKTQIGRIKSEVSGYTQQSTKDMGVQTEKNKTANYIIDKISQLDPNDWNKTAIAIEQLGYLLEVQTVNNQYNNQIVDRTKRLLNAIFKNMSDIYKYINNTQEQMSSLRQREIVLGKMPDQAEQVSSRSPAEEYSILQSVLEKLYRNPFDDKTNWYAQKAHSVLWDRLRNIQRGMGQDFNEWLSTPEQSNKLQSTQSNNLSISPEQKQTLLNDLNSIGVTPNQLIDILTILNHSLGATSSASEYATLIQQLKESLSIDQSTNEQSANPTQKTVYNEPAFHEPSTVQPVSNQPITNPNSKTLKNKRNKNALSINDTDSLDDIMASVLSVDSLYKLGNIVDQIYPQLSALIDHELIKQIKTNKNF